MLMSLGQHGVVKTFALTARFEVGLCLLVMKDSLREMLSGVVVMMGNLDRHWRPLEKKWRCEKTQH